MMRNFGNAGIAALARLTLYLPQLAQCLRQTLGHMLSQQGAQLRFWPLVTLLPEPVFEIKPRQQIDFNTVPGLPVGRDLQYGRATQATMGKQQVIAEAHAVAADTHRL